MGEINDEILRRRGDWEKVTDLDTPSSKNNDRRRIPFLVPQFKRGLCALRLAEYWRVMSIRRSTSCYFLLCGRVGDTFAVVRCEGPPGNTKEDCPER